ncbi:ATP-grasp domain-containing protein [Candidatus Zixiibacteriota bacterium]
MGALITFGRNRMAYTALKSLARGGIKTIVGDSFSPSMSFYSRFCHRHFVYPSPYLHPERFIETLAQKGKEHDCQVVIPMHEEGFVIARHRDRLEPHLKVPLADYDQIMTLHSKERFYALAQDLDVPIPKTLVLDRNGDIGEIARSVTYPAVLKPRRAHGSFGLRYIHSAGELNEILALSDGQLNPGADQMPILQEYVTGIKHSVCTLFNRGKLRALCTFKFLREYPIQGGTAVLRVSVKEERMEQIARRVLEHLQWHGIAEAEFTLTEDRGPVLMEINPRFWGSLYQGVAAGVDFPYLLYRMAVDGDVKPVLEYPLGVKTRWLWGDWRALCDYVVRPISQRRMLLDYLKIYRRDVTYDDFSIRDPLPFFVEMIYPFVSFITRGTFNPVERGSEYDREN